jgi:hypothetical protein
MPVTIVGNQHQQTEGLVLRDARFESSSGRGRSFAAIKPAVCRVLLPCLTLLSACAPASDYRPTVELGGLDTARYETDLRDCKTVAERDRYAPVVVGVLQGAVIGVALGTAIVGLGGGNVGLAQSYGAISGTVAGGAVGASQVQAPPDEKAIVDQCLRNNGYRL